YDVAGLRIGLVAVVAQVSIPETEDDEGEAGEAECCNPETGYYHVDEENWRKDASPETLQWTFYNIQDGAFETEAYVGHTRGDHDDPDDFDRSEQKDRQAAAVLEGKTDEEGTSLGNVLSPV
ncbi:hypothetical protein NKR23_g12440, partial [Pleurostoma richardsiae]